MLDPVTIALYRVALGMVIVLCGVGALYGLSRIGQAAGLSGLRGFMAWAITDGKSYGLAVIGAGATAAYALEYLSWDRWIIVMGLVNGTAIGTLRAASGKAEQTAAQAVTAAKVSAVKVERAVETLATAPPPPAAASPSDPHTPKEG